MILDIFIARLHCASVSHSKQCIVLIHINCMTVTLCPMTWDGITIQLLLFVLCPVSFHTSGGVVLGLHEFIAGI